MIINPNPLTTTLPNIWHGEDIWEDAGIWTDEDDHQQMGLTTSLVSGTYSEVHPSGTGMYKLLPTGDAWPKEHEPSVLKDFIYGLGKSLDRMNEAALSNLDILLPGDTGKYLQDWERFLGLPKCPDIEMTLQQRASSVLAMWNISPYSNTDFFVGLAAIFGFTVTVTNGTRGDVRDVFKIIIGVENPVNPIEFKAGASSAGDRLIEYDAGPIECLIQFFKPAHTYIIFEFTYPDAPADFISGKTSLDTVLMSGTYTAN
jgi:uncharacterized protein YmfQ (DUF2313 family)